MPRTVALAALSLAALSVAALSLLAGCGHDAPAEPAPSAPETITVTSTAFTPGGPIPRQYSCRGANTSPPLSWTGVPPRAAALALVVDDPDAPGGTFRHWIVVDIPPGGTGAPAGQPPRGGRQIGNSEGHASYDGPCPPSGTHHYRFTVYALSRALALQSNATLDRALTAIGTATVARGQLVGTFSNS